ncbi:MAG TPA: hypothetical protein VHF67_13635 [Gaiellaceae bacterium]|nr:hypothetical protein [Gaiellaceae bacterium]
MAQIDDAAGTAVGESTTGQAKDKAQRGAQEVSARAREGAEQVAGQAQEKAQELRGQASGRMREQVDTRSTQAGEQVQSLADAIRRTGETLRNEGKEGPARLTDGAAERAERLGGYLSESDADRILRDVEDFARRQPWLVAAGGFVLGLLGSRVLKASSSRRYQDSTAGGSWSAAGRPEFAGTGAGPDVVFEPDVRPAMPAVPPTTSAPAGSPVRESV